jgi:hypothetical protein
MLKFMLSLAILLSALICGAQTVGHVDKKTKEFYITAKPNTEYKIIGYQFANIETEKMICFSSYTYDVRGNPMKCPLGAYFGTGNMNEGDKIIFLGMVGNFGKMNFITGAGKKTIFYIPKTGFTVN